MFLSIILDCGTACGTWNHYMLMRRVVRVSKWVCLPLSPLCRVCHVTKPSRRREHEWINGVVVTHVNVSVRHQDSEYMRGWVGGGEQKGDRKRGNWRWRDGGRKQPQQWACDTCTYSCLDAGFCYEFIHPCTQLQGHARVPLIFSSKFMNTSGSLIIHLWFLDK